MQIETPLKNIPLSVQVSEIILKRIKDGVYTAGKQIPPENDLAKQLQVSRSTIRKAMGVLSARGMIVQKHGIGTFVSNISKINNPLNEAVEFNNLISRFGHKPAVLFPKVRLIKADEKMIEQLQLQPGDELLQSYKIFTADSLPVIYVLNSIPVNLISAEKIEKTLASPEITEPLYDFFEDCCGQRIEYHIASLKATVAGEVEFPDMPLDECDPLLLVEEVAYNTDELPLWHSMEYFPQNNQIVFNIIRMRI